MTPCCVLFEVISKRFIFLSEYVVLISCVILVALFSLQHYGTHRVAFMFAPIVTAWLLCISGIGIYNIFRWNPHIFHALSPIYMLRLLKSTGIDGWVSLGGVVLSITGTSQKFSDTIIAVYLLLNQATGNLSPSILI